MDAEIEIPLHDLFLSETLGFNVSSHISDLMYSLSHTNANGISGEGLDPLIGVKEVIHFRICSERYIADLVEGVGEHYSSSYHNITSSNAINVEVSGMHSSAIIGNALLFYRPETSSFVVQVIIYYEGDVLTHYMKFESQISAGQFDRSFLDDKKNIAHQDRFSLIQKHSYDSHHLEHSIKHNVLEKLKTAHNKVRLARAWNQLVSIPASLTRNLIQMSENLQPIQCVKLLLETVRIQKLPLGTIAEYLHYFADKKYFDLLYGSMQVIFAGKCVGIYSNCEPHQIVIPFSNFNRDVIEQRVSYFAVILNVSHLKTLCCISVIDSLAEITSVETSFNDSHAFLKENAVNNVVETILSLLMNKF